MITGTILNIQKFSIHDGPGIRTTVFLKGCPLNCSWCHNPESKKVKRELVFKGKNCIKCGDCVKNCPVFAVTSFNSDIAFNTEKCNKCGKCEELCPGNAIEIIGKILSVEDLLKEIKKDIVFYNESGGGVTFSGGEALLQIDFLRSVLDAVKQSGIHIVLDTSGYAKTRDILSVINNVDLFLYDLKHMNDVVHRELTGVSNKLILENLKTIVSLNKKVWIRIPILPGLNDDELNIKLTCDYLKYLKLEKTFLLPYTKLAEDKHSRLNMNYKHIGLHEPDENYMREIAEKFKYYGINVTIGG